MGSRIIDVQDHLSEVSDQTNKKFNIIKENVKFKRIFTIIEIYKTLFLNFFKNIEKEFQIKNRFTRKV